MLQNTRNLNKSSEFTFTFCSSAHSKLSYIYEQSKTKNETQIKLKTQINLLRILSGAKQFLSPENGYKQLIPLVVSEETFSMENKALSHFNVSHFIELDKKGVDYCS